MFSMRTFVHLTQLTEHWTARYSRNTKLQYQVKVNFVRPSFQDVVVVYIRLLNRTTGKML